MTVDCDVPPGQRHRGYFCGYSHNERPSSVGPGQRSSGASRTMRGAHAGEVFTISLHQENNYPVQKPPSSIDVDLPEPELLTTITLLGLTTL